MVSKLANAQPLSTSIIPVTQDLTRAVIVTD